MSLNLSDIPERCLRMMPGAFRYQLNQSTNSAKAVEQFMREGVFADTRRTQPKRSVALGIVPDCSPCKTFLCTFAAIMHN